jgi:pre-rRNA-processing protein IPI1
VEQLVALNVAAAQLLARFLPGQEAGLAAAPTAVHAAAPAAAAAAAEEWEQPWVRRLLAWFGGVMAEGAALPVAADPGEPQGQGSEGGRGGRAAAGGGGGASLPGEVYRSALDGTLRALPLLSPPQRAPLLAAAAALWRRSPPRGVARARVLAFWAALLRDPAAAFYSPTPGGGPLLQQQEAAAWLAGLPRFLFELGGAAPATSRAALELLLGAARSAPRGSCLEAELGALAPQMAPLWAVLLPAGGGSGGKGKPRRQQQQQQEQQQQQQEQQQQQQQQQQQAVPRVHVGPLAALPAETQVRSAAGAGWQRCQCGPVLLACAWCGSLLVQPLMSHALF